MAEFPLAKATKGCTSPHVPLRQRHQGISGEAVSWGHTHQKMTAEKLESDSVRPQKWVHLNMVYTPKMIQNGSFLGKLAISDWLWGILHVPFKQTHIAKRKQTMCDQQPANQQTFSVAISVSAFSCTTMQRQP